MTRLPIGEDDGVEDAIKCAACDEVDTCVRLLQPYCFDCLDDALRRLLRHEKRRPRGRP